MLPSPTARRHPRASPWRWLALSLALLALGAALLGPTLMRAGRAGAWPWALPGGKAAAPGRQITLAYTSNVEGFLDTCGCRADTDGGLDRRATLLRDLRAREPALLALDAGNFLSTAVGERQRRAQTLIAAMNLMGYDALNLAGDDLALGDDGLRMLRASARFPLLSANLRAEAAEPEPYLQRQMGDLQVAVLGLASPPPGATAGIAEDPLATAARLVPHLRGEADLVIVLGHLDVPTATRLAREVAGVDVVIAGQSPLVSSPPWWEGSTLIAHGGLRGERVGLLHLALGQHGLELVEARAERLSSAVPADPVIAGMLASLRAEEAAAR